MSPAEILPLINSAGVIGVLVFAVWLGLTGKVVPQSTIEAIVKHTVEAILQEFEERGQLPPK